MDYLCTQDERWRGLLECIVSHKTPIDEQGVLNIAVEANVVSQIVEFGKQLHAYLKAFTTGTAHRHITGAGREKIFEVWRQFNEVGRSRRPEHIFALRNKCNNPPKAASMQTLIASINEWEADRNYLAKISPEKAQMLDEDAILILMNICPSELENYFKREAHR